MDGKILIWLCYFYVVAHGDRFDVSENETEPEQYNDMEWPPMYFFYNINEEYYCYGQEFDKTWTIREILPGGKMGEIKSKGRWNSMYEVQFPYKINGRQFFYGQSVHDKSWFTEELLSGGQMGREMDHGNWPRFYDVQFPFSIDGRQFHYGQDLFGKIWFIRELLPDGKMGRLTDGDKSYSNFYSIQFPYSVGGNQYFYGQTRAGWSSHAWFIRRLLPDGKLGTEWDAGYWGRYYGVQFPYKVDGKQYFYGQNYPSNIWFTQELLAVGHMGNEIDSGTWKSFYEINFPFKIGLKQYFFRRHNSNWIIQELLPDGKMGKVTDRGNWYQAQ